MLAWSLQSTLLFQLEAMHLRRMSMVKLVIREQINCLLHPRGLGYHGRCCLISYQAFLLPSSMAPCEFFILQTCSEVMQG